MLLRLLKYLLSSVLDEPGRVQISCVETTKIDLFYLTAARGDLGRLLGRGGRTVEAIRQVMNAAAAGQGKEAILDVLEEQSAPRRSHGRSRRARPVDPKTLTAKGAQQR